MNPIKFPPGFFHLSWDFYLSLLQTCSSPLILQFSTHVKTGIKGGSPYAEGEYPHAKCRLIREKAVLLSWDLFTAYVQSSILNTLMLEESFKYNLENRKYESLSVLKVVI